MCEARQYSDQMLCDRCGLQWDANDPEPPKCAPLVVVACPGSHRVGKTQKLGKDGLSPDEWLRRIFALLDE